MGKKNWAEIFREDYDKYPLKGFEDDGHGNSVSDEAAKVLEDKYLDKWIIVYGLHKAFTRVGEKDYMVLAKVVSLSWSEGPWGGDPFQLQIDYVVDGDIDVHPQHERDVLYIFSKDKPSHHDVEKIMNELVRRGYRRK